MSDYERIARAINYIRANVNQQPSLKEVAGHINLSVYHFQRMFSRWAGVTPKRYLQILTVERAKLLLRRETVLKASDSLGLGSSSRLYDHFINLEAVTPGEFKKRGKSLVVEFAVHPTPFGEIFIALTPRGICKLVFIDKNNSGELLLELKKSWPLATFKNNSQTTKEPLNVLFSSDIKLNRPLSLNVTGTNFQISVWRALLKIPPATVTSYKQVAAAIGKPKAARAVGTANAANPVALIIPCHRVIQQSGKVGGYHWGETRLHAIHAWETARYEK